MIAGCTFYCIDFYDSAIFTLLSGLTMLAVYHAGLYNPVCGGIGCCVGSILQQMVFRALMVQLHKHNRWKMLEGSTSTYSAASRM
jgi:hypothetical protein